ncbi:centrosome and spindle pole-associated protein 1-like isoform X2 [Trematomus bernacchii]|uniref:centrosome and spindle pole-associated protein 1-like isoform X2 n=1 Tax=Trematomus bernacchii TaxID=40690 RepID=UPI00146C7E87|nr:centrosome and spindle pole-associated protein 1-like isoform X2 [Trematomus bernacchii]
MDDELEIFIRERRARVAEDKASLEQDPPYMEIKAKPHRAYGFTVKENIPPKSITQGKEDSYGVGLPLGVEYERKKQRLQHELRMDYRRYMAQQQAGVLSEQRPPSHRDAATLTEDSRELLRALRLAEGKPLCSEEDEERASVPPRHCDRLWDSEEEEELMMEGRRRRRQTGAEATHERRRLNKTDNGEKRENPGRGSRVLTKDEDPEIVTGLIIGADNTEEALRRRKERYRQELQEQIAEQHMIKKREKDFGLKVAATRGNDPETQPDRIRQLGLGRRGYPGESDSSLRALRNNVRVGVRERETPPPPELPHVAFQSPRLKYSSTLSLSPNSQPAPPSFPRASDTPRIPLFPPHPPSTVSEAFRSPYGEPHHYYGSRNLLEPNMAAYYGHLSVPGAGLPVSYWNLPPGGALPSQLGHHSPHSQHSGSSCPEPPTQPRNESAAGSQLRVFPSDRSRSTRERILSYREELKKQEAPMEGNSELYNQIQEQQEQRRVEIEERERYEAKLEADMKKHQPWGRGGGGAPLRDCTGNLIADLNQMHKLNEEAYMNPEQWQRRATAPRAELPDPSERVSGTVAERSSHDSSDRLSGFTPVATPQFARGSVFSNQPSQQQLHEQDQYKAYLKQQIDEKMLKKAEEKEQMRLEEEKEEKRLAEQRAHIQREYDEEQERKKCKEMEQKAKNEELTQLAEQRKNDTERKKKEAEEKEREAVRRQYERERQARVDEVYREPSPPIPALQGKHGRQQYTPRPPTVDSQQSSAPLSERSLSGMQSPPVPARRNQLRAAGDQREVYSELSALRRQLRSEQKRLQDRLQHGEWEELESPLSDRQQERPPVDVFEMARLRLQAPVRRPNSRNPEPRNLQRIHDSLLLKYTDGESRLGFSEVPKLEEVGVASRRRRGYRDPYQQSSQTSTAQDDYFDLSPLHQNEYLRSAMGGSAQGSLLESESAFIDRLGEAFPVPHTPELEKAPQLSARERRRLAKQPQRTQDGASSQHEAYSAHSGGRLQQEVEPRGDGRSYRAAQLMALSRRGNTAGPEDLSDDDCSPPGFSLHNGNRRGSVDTVSMDPWMRPGTSDTLNCLDRPSRRERLVT